jgi:hypothetical protein
VLALLWVSVGAVVWYGQLTITTLFGHSTDNCDYYGCGAGTQLGIFCMKCDLYFKLAVGGQNVLIADGPDNVNDYIWSEEYSEGKVVGTFDADEPVHTFAEVRSPLAISLL